MSASVIEELRKSLVQDFEQGSINSANHRRSKISVGENHVRVPLLINEA